MRIQLSESFSMQAQAQSSGLALEGVPEPDFCGAYLAGSGDAAPAHRQWCALLGLQTALVRSLAGHPDVRLAAVSFAVSGQDRLLSALEPLTATPAQPLTLAMLQVCGYPPFRFPLHYISVRCE